MRFKFFYSKLFTFLSLLLVKISGAVAVQVQTTEFDLLRKELNTSYRKDVVEGR